MLKTNVMRLLDAAGIPYRAAEYPWSEDDLTGAHAAAALGLPPEQVFKTLVARGDRTGPVVFVIPVLTELDLRRAAAATGNKSVALVHLRELTALTGYLRGGCSPVGMKKRFPTCFDETARLFPEIAVSAGARGRQVLVAPEALIAYLGAAEGNLAE